MNYLLILTAVVPLVVGLKVENLQWMSQIVSYYEPIPDEVSQSCRRQVQQYLLDLTNSSSWAWTMMDANGKFPSGSLTGRIKSIGRLEQCLQSGHPLGDYSGKYCLMLLNFTIEHEQVSNSWMEIVDETMGHRRNLENGKEWFKGILLFPLMTYGELGVCLPSSCSSSDVVTLTQVAVNRASQAIGVKTEVSLFDQCIDSGQNLPYTQVDCGVIALLASTLFATAIASLRASSDSDIGAKSTGLRIVESFSVRKNWNNFISTEETLGQLTYLNGIRAISTLWILLIHKVYFQCQADFLNKKDLVKSHDNYFLYPVWNGAVAVDTFFFISGLLLSYNMLRKLQNGSYSFLKQAIQRYLRITPVHLYVILFYVTIFYRIDFGPKWNYYVQRRSDACRNLWWKNLLFISNYNVKNNEMCIEESWYLSADMQLFLIAPVFLYPLYKWKNLGRALCLIVITASVVFTFFTTLLNQYPPAVTYNASNTKVNEFGLKIYLATHTRLPPYLMGIVIGSILHDRKSLDKNKLRIGWFLSLVCIYTCLWGAMGLTSPTHSSSSPLKSALFSGFHHIIWPVALSWIVYVCHTGNSNLLNSFLSAELFKFIAKLSYCIYLVHISFYAYVAGIIEIPTQIHAFLQLREFYGDFAVILMASMALHILVELPFRNLTKMIFSDQRIPKQTILNNNHIKLS